MSAKKSLRQTATVEKLGQSRNKRCQLPVTQSDISIALSEIHSQKREVENPRDRQLLLSFRGNTAIAIHQSVIQYLIEESLCSGAVILNIIHPGEEFRVFSTNMPFSTKKFPGVSQVLSKKSPHLLSDTDKSNNCNMWKQILKFLPKVLIFIPIKLINSKINTVKVEAIAVLGFKGELPSHLAQESSWSTLIGFCQLTAPLLVNVQRYEEAYFKAKRTSEILQAVRETEKVVQDISSCIHTIGLELQSLFGATHLVMFIVQDQFIDAKLLKYYSLGGGNIDNECPNRELHGLEEISQAPDTPIGWTATNNKCFRVNGPFELKQFNFSNNKLHSIGGCIIKNIMCISILDFVDETPLVVEMSGKAGEFSRENEEESNLFVQRMSFILSSAVLLDYRKKAGRRNDINNEVLNNIKAIQFKKVKQLLDMKFRYSHSFQKKFSNFNYVLRQLPTGQLPGVILYMFTELGFISRWKIRRATLIRFILSIKQGYKDNPYHNWKHACNVTHFGYLILKKLELQKHHLLSDIEAFAFIIACLCHDVDHRGVNSHFSLCADPETYHMYSQEDSVMERHHVAVTLQVLSSDDCNIVESLSDDEYKEFVDLIQWNILATDLGKYLSGRNELFLTLKTFDKQNEESRRSLMAVLMTMCDLSETIKPWNDYIRTVKSIFSEFFTQGDDEIALGFNPTPMMDRRIAYIPYIEMKFINDIVRPAYQAIAELLPGTEECLQTIEYYKELWLVATKVFDDNTHLEDPLQIIDLKDMREEKLKRVANPRLERHATRIRESKTLIQGLSPLLPLSDSNTRTNLLDSEDFKSVVEEEDFQKTTFIGWLRKFFCCYNCRRKALSDAALLTKHHQEDEFLEERSESYERKRSSASSVDSLVNRSVRSRINMLINPERLDQKVKNAESKGSSKVSSKASKGSTRS